MNLSKRLRERRAAAERVEEIRERIGKLRAAVTRTTPRYGSDGGGGSGEDKMLAYMARLDQLERELTRASRRAYRLSMHAMDVVERLPERTRAVIIRRDFYGETWRAIEAETGIPASTAKRIRDSALGIKSKKKRSG